MKAYLKTLPDKMQDIRMLIKDTMGKMTLLEKKFGALKLRENY